MNLIKEYIKKPYIQRTETFSKKNIKRFIRPEWHRDYRQNQISAIMNGLKKGIHFNENITVNELNGKFRIINGNHRVEAIKRIIDKHDCFMIEGTLTVYKDLNVDEEREIYSIIAKAKPETTDDYIKSRCSDSKIFKLIKKDFPCGVGFYKVSSTSRNYIHFGTLVRSYLSRDTTTRVIGAFTKDKIVDMINILDDKDYERMKEYMEFFIKIFGEPSRMNHYSEFHKFVTIARIFYVETGMGIGKTNLEKRIRYLKVKSPQIFDRAVHNFQELYFYYEDLIRALNMVRKFDRGNVSNMFLAKKSE